MTNDISLISQDNLEQFRALRLFDYQNNWHNIKNNSELNRIRFIRQSRLIGTSFYFYFEAFEDAVINGDNQFFITPSAEGVDPDYYSHAFKQFVKANFDLELSGKSVITLSNGSTLTFLPDNHSTFAAMHGHVYLDHVFYMKNFINIFWVAKGIASHKRLRLTMSSSETDQPHDAKRIWAEKPKDGIWRQTVTIEEAINDGNDLINIEDQKKHQSKKSFNLHFMCQPHTSDEQ